MLFVLIDNFLTILKMTSIVIFNSWKILLVITDLVELILKASRLRRYPFNLQKSSQVGIIYTNKFIPKPVRSKMCLSTILQQLNLLTSRIIV